MKLGTITQDYCSTCKTRTKQQVWANGTNKCLENNSRFGTHLVTRVKIKTKKIIFPIQHYIDLVIKYNKAKSAVLSGKYGDKEVEVLKELSDILNPYKTILEQAIEVKTKLEVKL